MNKIGKENLKKKFQPQWFFGNAEQFREELNFQKSMNPSTYKWLLSKDILIGGKRVSARNALILKKKMTRLRGF